MYLVRIRGPNLAMRLQVKTVPIFPNNENETYKRHSQAMLIISLFAKKTETKKLKTQKLKLFSKQILKRQLGYFRATKKSTIFQALP